MEERTEATGGEPAPAPVQPSRRRHWGRWLAWGALGLVILLLLVAGGLVLALPRLNLAGPAAGWIGDRLGRTVSIASLHVLPGRVIRLRIEGARVANASWGSGPDLYALDHAELSVEAVSLLHGPARILTADVTGLRVLLEHGPGHQPNWRDGPPAAHPDNGRDGFPSVRDLTGHDIRVEIRTSSGRSLVTALDSVGLHSADDHSPVRLQARGRQGDAPVELDATLHSFEEFRAAQSPFGTEFILSADDAVLQFAGTMTDPLNVDGAEGDLILNAPSLAPALAAGGAAGGEGIELHLTGRASRNGDEWALRDATGALSDNIITAANLALHEGSPVRGQPDRIDAEVAFDGLDAGGKSGGGGAGGFPLTTDADADPEVRAKISAGRVSFGDLTAMQVSLSAEMAGRELRLTDVAGDLGGTRITGAATLARGRDSGRLQAQAVLSATDLQSARRLLGLRSLPLLGALQGQAEIDGTGATLDSAIDRARISTLLWMRGGSIAREVVEMASTDIRALFRTARGMTPVTCMILGVDLRGGAGTIGPMRVRAEGGTISGFGRVDLRRKTLDLSFASERRTTGALALDVPIRVSGSFANPSIAPARWSPQGRAALAAADSVAALPASLQREAARHACPR